jgi:hypothetical protein
LAYSRRGRRQRSQSQLFGIVAAIVLLLLVGGGVWWWLARDRSPSPGELPMATEPSPETDPTRPGMGLDEELPELDRSDEWVRGVVQRLSQHPRLAEWLATDELVRRFVLVVVDVAGNSNPAANMSHMRPAAGFQAQQEEGRLVIAPESHRRYDMMAAAFASLDTEGTMEAYRRLYPLMEEAYQELGIPDYSFHDMLRMALQNLRGAQLPDEPVEVVGEEGIYVFRDAELEELRGLEKAMIRLGPANARQVQAKADELLRELDARWER